jgi:small subunit ribosomal protein S3
MGTRVTLTIERPGLVIGRKGSSIKQLERAVNEDFNFDNPKIEVQEENQPSLNAQIMAEKLASALERGWHFRRAGHSTVRRIMESGAKGCQVVISGKLTGQRHRMEKFKKGHIKFCGEPALEWMDEGFAVAKRKLGVIGVKVQIMNPQAKLPDEIEVAPKEVPKEEEPVAPVKKEPEETKVVEKPVTIDKKEPEKEKAEQKTPEDEVIELPDEAAEEDVKADETKTEEPAVKEEKEEVKSNEPDKVKGN